MRNRGRAVLAALGVLAFAFGAPSLSYPFGRDQGLYFYVAREWVLRGAIPYRDVLDHKTPGIYILHAFLIFVFGPKMWAIRVADMACVAGLGFVSARIVTPRGQKTPLALIGLAWTIASVFFYGYLNWWDTAQSELWYSTLALASIACVRSIAKEKAANFAGGAFAAMAMIMKPPAIWLVLLAVIFLVQRVWPEKEGRIPRVVFALVHFGAGALLPIVLVFGYFGAKHALAAMADIVIGANGYYVAHEKGVTDPTDMIGRILDYVNAYTPFCAIGVLGLIAGIAYSAKKRDDARRRRYVLGALVALAGFVAVVMQQKFYLLHWGVMVGPATVVFTVFAYDAIEGAADDLKRVGLCLATLVFSFILSGRAVQGWYASAKNAVASKDHAEFVSRFAFPEISFVYADSEAAGLWLKEHSSPDDFVSVRGFQPEVYAVAERRHYGRFFWTTFITNPSRAYRRAEWLAEDKRDLETHPPRFVVVLKYVAEGPDSEAYFPGYERRAEFGELVILERAAK